MFMYHSFSLYTWREFPIVYHHFMMSCALLFLLQVSHPFVVNLYYAFQTSDKLCFILDLMNGSGCMTVCHCYCVLYICIMYTCIYIYLLLLCIYSIHVHFYRDYMMCKCLCIVKFGRISAANNKHQFSRHLHGSACEITLTHVKDVHV